MTPAQARGSQWSRRMRSVTRFVIVVALLWGLAAPAAAGARRFIPTEGRPGLAKVQKRGKLKVSRKGNKIRVRAFIPATRKGVPGVEVAEFERDAAPQAPDAAEIAAAGESFEKAVEIAADQTWRKDLGPRDFYRGALSRIRSKKTLDEVAVYDHALDGVWAQPARRQRSQPRQVDPLPRSGGLRRLAGRPRRQRDRPRGPDQGQERAGPGHHPGHAEERGGEGRPPQG